MSPGTALTTRPPSPPVEPRDRDLRLTAGLLAFVSTAWAVFGTIGMIEDRTWHFAPWRRDLLVFASSYAVAAILCWRTLGRPSLKWRRGIWGLSSLVYGATLSLFFGGGGGVWSLFFMIAFAGATIVSLLGVVAEAGRPAAVA